MMNKSPESFNEDTFTVLQTALLSLCQVAEQHNVPPHLLRNYVKECGELMVEMVDSILDDMASDKEAERKQVESFDFDS